MSDEEIIVESLLMIKNGVLTGDWQLVCNAYTMVTGEEIEVPQEEEQQPEGKIDKIRRLMQEKSEQPVSKQTGGRKKKTVKKKNKKEDDTVGEVDESEITIGTLTRTRQTKGAKRFGSDKIQLVSTFENEDERDLNSTIVKKKVKRPPPIDILKETNISGGDIRFNPNPTI